MDKKPIVIIGAGQHAALILEILERQNFSVVGFTDNTKKTSSSHGFSILGCDDILSDLLKDGVKHAAIGIGSRDADSCAVRAGIYSMLLGLGFEIPSLIHSSATVSSYANIGNGCQVLAGVILQPKARIMNNVLLNAGSIVEHDCIIHDHATLGSGAVLCGGVSVGECTHIGAGSTTRQGIKIGKHATIGMGAAVIKDVEDSSTVIGVPAKPQFLRR